MSVQAMGWALKVPIGGNAKVILLGVANHAHPDGTNAYPAISTLAGYAHCDRRTVQRNLRVLEADGWIRRDGTGPGGRVMWSLPMPMDDQGRQNAAGERQPAEGRQNATGAALAPRGGAAPAPPKPSLEPSLSGSPAVCGHGRARAAAPAPARTTSLSPIEEDRTGLAEHVRGILQRGIDGLTSSEPAKPPTLKAVRAALAKHDPPRDVAVAAAVTARSIAQSQDRAPNICALFAQRLAAPHRPVIDDEPGITAAQAAEIREFGRSATAFNASAAS